jgi:hypothetical protein
MRIEGTYTDSDTGRTQEFALDTSDLTPASAPPCGHVDGNGICVADMGHEGDHEFLVFPGAM